MCSLMLITAWTRARRNGREGRCAVPDLGMPLRTLMIRKRRRLSKEAVSIISTSGSSFNSTHSSVDDSVVWIKKPYTQAPVEVALSSSDDDPHTGQVTPHHLISPAIRRVQDNDPPSDDSIMSSSPSRDLATRRKQRASFAYLKQSPVNMA